MQLRPSNLGWLLLGLGACLLVPGLLDAARGTDRSALAASGVQIEQQGGALAVKIDDELFFRYVYEAEHKPYCWPIIGPTGKRITRAFPMEQVSGEAHDHPHQRSMWFTHGEVGGVDFWSEGRRAGRQVHRKFELAEGGAQFGRIRQINDWLAPDGRKICEDTRELKIYASKDPRIIDFRATVRASEGELVFGDTKEGSFGLRVATTMRSDKQGRIVNSRGQTDRDAWGKPAEWVDYSGIVEGDMVGMTIMDHPSSFRHPTHWHVRTYGLFAANPFGLHDFYSDNSKDGSYRLEKGDSITFRYRIFLHTGDAEAAGVAEAYRRYARSTTAAR